MPYAGQAYLRMGWDKRQVVMLRVPTTAAFTARVRRARRADYPTCYYRTTHSLALDSLLSDMLCRSPRLPIYLPAFLPGLDRGT